ncbi:MAG TPA: S8 family serine peptidase, partial [Fimbriimonadaceae bacterium]|nr:S8 family serine peptidase [Fimbriimonadaceae bacterium]
MFSKYRVLIAIVLGSIAAMSSANTTVDFVSNEVLVKFKGTGAIANSYATIANRAIGAQTKTVIPRVNVNLVRVPAGMSPDDAVFYYSRLSTVEYAEKNAKKQLHFTPNDTLFNQQYGQKKVKCPEGWDISKGLDTVVVAVIDTGVDLNHEDLKNKVVAGFDFSDNDSDPTAAGDHGVHTAGIVGAETNNNKGVAGTGYNVKVMP